MESIGNATSATADGQGQFSSPSTQESDHSRMPDLPFEVITEILMRLPVKPLLKFRCVSKSWLSLISTPQFIKDHLSFSTSVDKQHLLVVSFDQGNSCLKHCSLKSLLYEQPTDAVEVDYPPMKSPNKFITLVGCCNGLICIFIKGKGLFLWNPSTRKFKKLPDLDIPLHEDDYYISYGFGYDEVSDDYKVVAVICFYDDLWTPFESEVMVYSIKTESWRSIGEFHGGFPLEGTCGSFVNGTLHWELDKAGCGFVVSLDLATEIYGCVDLAIYTSGWAKKTDYDIFEPELGTFGGNLCLFCRDKRGCFADVWVMKEYGVQESWTKVLSIPSSPLRYLYTALCISDNGRFLVVLKRRLRLYDPKDKSSTLLLSSININIARTYVESLVLPSFDDPAERQQQQQ